MTSKDLKDVYLSEQHLEEGIEAVQGFFDELKTDYAEATAEEKGVVSYLA